MSKLDAGSNGITKLSILVPVYNEIRTIEYALDRVLNTELPCDREIIVVDDCSTDGSYEFLEQYVASHEKIHLFKHEKNQGKGAAIRTAIEQISGDWAIVQDADLEYDPQDYKVLIEPVEQGLADAVFGSRYLFGRYRRAMYFWHTEVNRFLTILANIFSDLNLTDMETGYKLIRTDILKNLVLHSNRFDFEAELTLKLAKWGARVYEVPISYTGRTYAEGKKIGPKDAIRTLWALIRYQFLDGNFTKHQGYLLSRSLEKAKRFNRWLFSQFEQWLGDEVLEVGCGIGNLTTMALDKKRLVCIDREQFYVDRLKQSYGNLSNFKVFKADLTNIEEFEVIKGEEPFDSVLNINLLEHTEDDVEMLKNLYKLLKPKGRIICLVPNSMSLYTEMDRSLGHVRRYDRAELCKKMEEAGFEVLKCWGYNRVGGLGWRISGKILGNSVPSTSHMRLFNMAMPIIRLLEMIPFHKHSSLIATGQKPE